MVSQSVIVLQWHLVNFHCKEFPKWPWLGGLVSQSIVLCTKKVAGLILSGLLQETTDQCFSLKSIETSSRED